MFWTVWSEDVCWDMIHRCITDFGLFTSAEFASILKSEKSPIDWLTYRESPLKWFPVILLIFIIISIIVIIIIYYDIEVVIK